MYWTQFLNLFSSILAGYDLFPIESNALIFLKVINVKYDIVLSYQ